MSSSTRTRKGKSTPIDRIREVRRRPCNRKCFDCTEKSPSSVCLDLGTFVCMTCSGIHREFGRKVKSLSAASFNEDEAILFENGGNDVAEDKWLHNYNPSDFPTPNSIEVSRIKEFMSLKYDAKRYVKQEKPQTSHQSKGKKKKSSKPRRKSKKSETESSSSESDSPQIRQIEDDFPNMSIVVNTDQEDQEERQDFMLSFGDSLREPVQKIVKEEAKKEKKQKKTKKKSSRSRTSAQPPDYPPPGVSIQTNTKETSTDLLDLFSFQAPEASMSSPQSSNVFEANFGSSADESWGFPQNSAPSNTVFQPIAVPAESSKSTEVVPDPFEDLLLSTPLQSTNPSDIPYSNTVSSTPAGPHTPAYPPPGFIPSTTPSQPQQYGSYYYQGPAPPSQYSPGTPDSVYAHPGPPQFISNVHQQQPQYAMPYQMTPAQMQQFQQYQQFLAEQQRRSQ